MIFFDNIIFSLQHAGGISAVWKELLRNLSMDCEFACFEYDNANGNLFRRQLSIPKHKLLRLNHFSKVFSQFQKVKVKFDKPFIFHSSYFRLCSNKNAKNVTTVHDFIYEQGRMNLRQHLRVKMNYNAIRKSDAIVCVSENTRRDLIELLPDIDISKVHVIYNGVSEDYFQITQAPYPKYRDSILYVGGRQEYKNFDFVVKSLEATDLNLLICGSPLSCKEKHTLDLYLPERYEVIEFPSNEELNRIYNSVYCLAYPSSYEGFGIPVLEAQRAGCPVVAFNASSIPEIIGEEALLMESLIPENFIDLLNCLKNKATRERIVAAGLKNSARFSWKRMTDEYLSLYKSLIK